MKNKKSMCFIALFQVLVVLISAFFINFAVSADTQRKIYIEASKETVLPGDELTVTVKTNEAFSAFAFNLDIGFDKNAFTVSKISVADSSKIGLMSGVADGKLKVNWMAESSAEEWNNGTLFVVYFKSNKTASGEKAFNLDSLKVLDAKLKKVEFNVGGEIKVNLKAAVKSEKVKNAEEKIAAIGTVKADVDSLNRITEAQLAFNECSASEKILVENRSVLEKAIETYNKLKAEQAAEENKKKLEEEIKKFKEDHKALLNLTDSTVKGTDVANLNAALIEYGTKSTYVKNRLKTEYDKLLALYQKASQLATAPEMVESFLNEYEGVLSLNPKTLSYSDEGSFNDIRQSIESALATYENFNDVAKSMLKKQYELLKQLQARCDELAIENSPEPEYVTQAYNAFRKKYLSILLKTEGEVTKSDLSKIQNALSELKSLKPQVSGKLITEYEHLMNLLYALENEGGGNSGTDPSVITNTVEVPVDRIVEVPVETQVQVPVDRVVETSAEELAKNTDVSIPSSGKFGIIVFVMMFTAFVLFATPVGTYFILKAKKEREDLAYETDIEE